MRSFSVLRKGGRKGPHPPLTRSPFPARGEGQENVRGGVMNLLLVDQSREKAYPFMLSTFRKTVFIISLSSFHEDMIKRFPPSFKTRLLS